MSPARRRAAVVGTVIVVVVVSLTIILARASLGTAPLSDLTPTAFVYAPVVFRDHAPSTPTATTTPTPTATPTSTPTLVPAHQRLYLCCFSAINETCSQCSGSWRRLPGEFWDWRSDGLPRDIDGTTYEFGIVVSSEGSTVFEVELFLMPQDLLLASAHFTSDSPDANRYVQVVQGIDPAVTINEDSLRVRITNVSGAPGSMYFGDPDKAEAGGSYVEFPQSR